MTKDNPFNVLFGVEPKAIISRDMEIREIYDSFLGENSNSQAYIISGARGSGKTVAMKYVSDNFKKMDQWIVIELNPDVDMLEQLASKLIDEGKLKKLFLKAEFNFSFKGFGFSISGSEPILNISTLLKRELEYLSKKKYKILITIDEVSNTDFMGVFAHEYQLLLRNGFPVFLLMTGLYKNIVTLSRQKNLTFLIRTPRIYLGELNKRSITNSYMNVFNVEEKNAIKLTKFTNGYAFAYQLLGNILFTSGKKEVDKFVLQKYDEALQERSYNFVFDELSDKEKEIVMAAVDNPENKHLQETLKISSNQLSNYKKSLFLKSIIESDYRNKISFVLPRFKEYLAFIKEISA